MRYFFHIVDRYGLFPDVTGCDCADHGAAVLHAGRIATELAKAGEFFRSSVVFVARTAVSKPSPARGQDLATPIASQGLKSLKGIDLADFLPLLPTENPRCASGKAASKVFARRWLVCCYPPAPTVRRAAGALAKRERKETAFKPFEAVMFAATTLAACAGVYVLAAGVISVRDLVPGYMEANMNIPAVYSALILVGLVAAIGPSNPSLAQTKDSGVSAPASAGPASEGARPNTNTNPTKHRYWRHQGGRHPHYGSRRVRT